MVWQKYQADPKEAHRNQLVERYLPLVTRSAQRLSARLPDRVDVNDLVSAGVFGLVDAIKAFDASRGTKFETFCALRIRGAMLDELRAIDWVPRLARSRSRQIARATERFEAQHGRHPTDHELAEQMGISVKQLKEMLLNDSVIKLTSLNSQVTTSDGLRDVTELDNINDVKGEDPTRRTQKIDLMRLVTKGLNSKERLIIILYYYERLTMKEIGETLALSESRVSQMHSAILARLRDQLFERQLEFAA